jgi:hypothetical protein
LAQALFNQGKKLMAAGKYAEACAKFQASNRTAPGTGTLLNLAVCHEKLGRLASAWVEFSSAADADRREGNQRRLEYSQQQMQKLAPQLAHITINAPAGPAVPGLVVKLDGAALAPAALGVPAPVDPGKHVVAATAPGRQSWSKQITVAKNGENHEISIPALSPPAGAPAGNAAPSGTPAGGTPAGGTPPAGSAPQSGATSATPGGTPPTTTGKTSNPRRIGAYVAGGVGVVGIGLGSYFGLKAFSDWKKRNDNCPNGRCNQTAVTAHDSAHTAAIVSDVSFGVGVAALGAAAYLWFTSSPASSEKPPGAMAHWRVVPMVAQRGGGLRLGREF